MAEEQVEGDASGSVARSKVRKIVRPLPNIRSRGGYVAHYERGLAAAALAVFCDKIDPARVACLLKSGVYAVSFEKCDRIKVGYATNVEARLREHQTSMPYPIELLMFAPGPAADEDLLHEKLAMYRRCGEWFEWTHAVGLYLQAHARPRGGDVV